MEEPITVGLTAEGHDNLKRLKEHGYFGEMQDAYRFAIALGLAHNARHPGSGAHGTIFNVGTIDPDRSIYNAIKAIVDNHESPIYSLAEEYAEWGVAEMIRSADKRSLSLATLLEEAAEMTSTGIRQ